MKKTALLIITLELMFCVSFSQNIYPVQAKLSPLTQQYLLKSEKNLSGKPLPGYVYKITADGKIYISALIKVDKNLSENYFADLGVRIGTKAGNIWTAQVPVEHAEEFTRLKGISYIQFDEPITPCLDSLRKVTRVDSVHAGYGLPIRYNGDGVVVGVIDYGFDYGHPEFFDTTGTGYRVVKVWEQKTVTGVPPSGYIYGSEMTDSTEMWSKGTDNKDNTHGTHVAGICAGSGVGSTATTSTRYRGVAYKADVVLVGIFPDNEQWINTGASDVIDGVNYIYSYATSVGKPAVANLSWGNVLGPHDGSSLFATAIDNLTDVGKIFVCAAGNSGVDYIHIDKDFSTNDTLLNTFVDIGETPEGKKTWLDTWGEKGKTFCSQITLYKDSSTAGNTTGFLCIDDSTHDTFIIGSDNDTCFVTVTSSASEFNQLPRTFITLYNKSTDHVCFTVKASDGKINAWNNYYTGGQGYKSTFTNLGQPWATNGNTDMTISDLAVTKSAISVGAYTSKRGWRSASGLIYSLSSSIVKGDIAFFSSKGPSVDGRVCPDICAPGMTITAGASSYDSTLYSTGDSYYLVTNKYHSPRDGRDYPFATFTGTSMASPAVAGIVALMLQAYPYLTPQQAKTILTETAIQDKYTGVLPAGGNNLWGNGKVNAYAAVKKTLMQYAGIDNSISGNIDCALFPNPGNGQFSLTCFSNENENTEIAVYDLTGRKLMQQYWTIVKGENLLPLNLEFLSKGVYFIKLSSDSKNAVVKAVVN